jgi:hypothetical protein
LRRLRDAEIREGIEADPYAHPTEEEFWKNAKVVPPRHKRSP